jgi:hypothetical protein
MTDITCPKKLKEKIGKTREALERITPADRKLQRTDKILNYLTDNYTKPTKSLTQPEYDVLKKYSDTGKKVRPPKPTQADRIKSLKAKIEERKLDLEHDHKIVFRFAKSESYDIPNLQSGGSFWKYWLLNAKKVNGNGWGVSDKTIHQNIARFIGRPFVVTAKEWIENSEYGAQYEHPYVPTNHLPTIFSHQAKFTVGIIKDVYKDSNDDFYATIEPLPKFAQRTPPPFCSPAIFQLDPHEPENAISKWEALHLAGLDRDPAYGAAIAMLKGTCIGTANECSVQFHGAKQQTAAFGLPPRDVIDSFLSGKPHKMDKKVLFKTDGKNLYYGSHNEGGKEIQHIIAKHGRGGMYVSYQGHPSLTTSTALRMLGINTRKSAGKYFIGDKEIDPSGFDYHFVSKNNIQGEKVTINPNLRNKIQTIKDKQINSDQDIFRRRVRTNQFGGPRKTGEDPTVVQPEDQKLINSITGVKSPIPNRTFGVDAHHILPREIYPQLNKNVNNGIMLDKNTHADLHKLNSGFQFRRLVSKLRQKVGVVDRQYEKKRMNEGHPHALDPKEYAFFDEVYTKDIPPVRVNTHRKFPEIDPSTSKELNVPLNVERGSGGTLGGFTSPLGEELEDKIINRKLLKERGEEETFTEHFLRKFGPGRFDTKSPTGIHKQIGTISLDNAKKYSKRHIAKYNIQTPAEVKINPEHGLQIADAYDQMKHEPNKPEVKEAYDALINETGEQFKQLIKGGLKITKLKSTDANPYPTSKHMHEDIEKNNHLYYFPTEQGFGQGENNKDHPMMRPTEFQHDGGPLLANDVFRIVHDVNGHHLGGKTSFGPKGEHQAFIQHSRMYSPIAKKAFFTETAGQNNWVNFSRSHGEKNRANPKNTTFAEQKAGLLPDDIINGKFHI